MVALLRAGTSPLLARSPDAGGADGADGADGGVDGSLELYAARALALLGSWRPCRRRLALADAALAHHAKVSTRTA